MVDNTHKNSKYNTKSIKPRPSRVYRDPIVGGRNGILGD